tara:strand:- start:42537 stop:43385 length:849 start_codon:yes stop_codon:yes gene_type:complete
MIKKPYLIAEIGINHNGDLKIAKELILNAKQANFDAVKFQKRDIETVYSKEQLETPRESPWGTTSLQQKQGLEFSESDYDIIDDFCKKTKIDWFASAWEIQSLNFLKKYDLKYNKIASAMIVDINFLIEVAKEKKHTFISTGMSSKENIRDAVNIFKENNCSFELMHCVSTYPMKPEDANLLTIKELKKEYNCDVGYSGHENGVLISLIAASMGITSLERHITLDRTMYGSDQSASLELQGMISLTDGLKKCILSMGENKLGHVTKEEEAVAKKLRSHIKIN